MLNQKCNMKNFSYDKRFDILSVHNGFQPDEKFAGNEIIGDLVLDTSTKKRVVGIELFNASEFLKVNLDDIKDADLEASWDGDCVTIELILKFKNHQIPAKIAVPIEMAKV